MNRKFLKKQEKYQQKLPYNPAVQEYEKFHQQACKQMILALLIL